MQKTQLALLCFSEHIVEVVGARDIFVSKAKKKASKMIVTSFSLRTAILKEKRCCGWTEMNHAFDRGGN